MENEGPALLRRGSDADLPFMREMLFEAAHPGTRPRPPIDEWYARTEMVGFLAGWGRRGDVAVIAEHDGQSVGAAWCRLFTDADHLWGYVDDQTPELAIAVRAEWRGRGVGRLLLEGLIAEARAAGFARLSLSVERTNTVAERLYRSLGFREVRVAEGGPIMLLDAHL